MTNQSNYKNNQNYDIDIEEFYNSIISEIDSIRGYVNISSPNNLKKISKLKLSDFSGISGKLQVDSSFQESRIHAFYRLIGFPVLSSNNDFYNPGHDGIAYLFDNIFGTKIRKTSDKLNIANSPINGFYQFSSKRESYFNSEIKQNYNYQNINTSVFLLSLYNIRNFNDHIDKYNQVFDLDINNSSYLVKLSDPLNRSLLEYTDGGNVTKLTSKRYHHIFPLIVDPRLDLAAIKRPSVPFPWKQSQIQVNETTVAKLPILQSIIESRFISSNRQGEIGQYGQEIVDFIKSNNEIKDEDLINKIQDPTSYGLVERQMFLKFINLISSMVDELVLAQNDIDLVFGITLYLPMCGLNGPEFGIKSYNTGIFNTKFNSELDKNIQLFQTKAILNSILPQNNTNEKTETYGSKIQDFIGSIISPFAKAFGDRTNDSYEELLATKKSFDNKASDALRKIEIIMGECSGLGLCDIIAILAGLYLVERKYLLGLLDEDAFNRASKKLNLSKEEKPTIIESIEQIQKTIFDMYNIMQIIYTERKQFGIKV